jgi:hypothetical protein
MKQKPEIQRIAEKTGMKPTKCKCQECKLQCRASCLGTPADLQKLIDAGHIDKLQKYVYNSPYALRERITIFRIKHSVETGSCVFFVDGLCQLHDAGLKPTEGKLSHHSRQDFHIKLNGSNSIALNVARSWDVKSYTKIGNQIMVDTFLKLANPKMFGPKKPAQVKCGHCMAVVDNNLQALADHCFNSCSAIEKGHNPPSPNYIIFRTTKKKADGNNN